MGRRLHFTSKTTVFGIDWGHHSVKAVGLQKRGSAFKLIHCALFLMPTNGNNSTVEDKIINKIQLWHGKDVPVVVGVNGNDVIARYVKLPDMPEREFRKAALWEIRDQLYFDAEDAILWSDYFGKITEGVTKKAHGVAYAVRKSAVQIRIEKHQKLSLRPEMVVLSADADRLSRVDEARDPILILNIGHSKTQIAIAHHGKVVFIRDANFGTTQVRTEISSNLGISAREAESIMKKMELQTDGVKIPDSSYSEQDLQFLFQYIRMALEPLVDEIQLSLQFFSSQLHEIVTKISLLGGGALNPGFEHYLEEKIGLPVEINNPFQFIEMDEDDFDREALNKIAPLFSTAVGLAKSRFASGREALNILGIIKQKEKTERKKSAVFRLTSLSIILFILIFEMLFSYKTTTLQNKKIVLDARYKTIRHRLEFLKELKEKTGILNSKFKTLLEVKGEQTHWSVILKSLGKTIPEGTWITDFEAIPAQGTGDADMEPDNSDEETAAAQWQLHLKGKSYSGGNVRIFYNRLQKMPYFSDVTITRIALSDEERSKNLLEFEIHCRMAENFGQIVQRQNGN